MLKWNQLYTWSPSYCWWKKSCTSWYGKYHIYLQGFSTIPGGCLEFLPSTVPLVSHTLPPKRIGNGTYDPWVSGGRSPLSQLRFSGSQNATRVWNHHWGGVGNGARNMKWVVEENSNEQIWTKDICQNQVEQTKMTPQLPTTCFHRWQIRILTTHVLVDAFRLPALITTYLFEKHLDPSSMQDDIDFARDTPQCGWFDLVWCQQKHTHSILPYRIATTSNCTSCKVVLTRGYVCLCDVPFFVFLKKTVQKSPTIMANNYHKPLFPWRDSTFATTSPHSSNSINKSNTTEDLWEDASNGVRGKSWKGGASGRQTGWAIRRLKSINSLLEG